MLPDFLRVGPPTARIFLIETMLFTGMMFLLGRNNTEFLASLGLIFQYATMAMMIPIGLSQATVQRVPVSVAGNVGNSPANLKQVTQASLVLVGLYLVVLAVLHLGFEIRFSELFVVGAPLDTQVLDDIDRAKFLTFAIIAFHALIIVMAGILRGIGDVQSRLWIVLICYWGAELGLGVYLIEVAGYLVENSIKVVAIAKLLSLLSILLRFTKTLRCS